MPSVFYGPCIAGDVILKRVAGSPTSYIPVLAIYQILEGDPGVKSNPLFASLI